MSDAKRVLLYGANGYTGNLIARLARQQPDAPELVLAGRSASKVAPIAKQLGYQARVFGLDVASTIDACLEGIDVVLHCAGPFSRTAVPMAEACMRARVHYLDVTGELDVFSALEKRDADARSAGIMLMPGVGYDVVPSDCLALHTAGRIMNPTKLRIALRSIGGQVSHGTATTITENIHKGSAVRRGGQLKKVAIGKITRKVDFGRGPKPVMNAPLGDLVTAFHSTGIGDIECFVSAKPAAILGARALGFVPWLLESRPLQKLMKRRIDAAPAGPTDEQRAQASTIIWAEVENAAGQRATSRLHTPEGYTTTALAALGIAKAVCEGKAQPGYRSPAQLLGADFILSIPGTRFEDLS